MITKLKLLAINLNLGPVKTAGLPLWRTSSGLSSYLQQRTTVSLSLSEIKGTYMASERVKSM